MNELLLTLAILHGADSALTLTALHHGAYEVNPILGQDAARNTTIKAAAAGAEIGLLWWLDRTGHRRAARIAATVGISFEAAIVGHNVAVYVRMPRPK
jgi:hypothetical protein